MARKLGFKKSHRDTLRENNAADAFYAAMSGKAPRNQAVVPEKRRTRIDAHDIDAVHRDAEKARPMEADVIAAVTDLLKAHPKVLWAIRINSGAASYQTASGAFAPVWFHKWVKGTDYRMSDFIGATVTSRILAIECKRPGWTHPTDKRETEQAAFLDMVRKNGGIGIFCTDASQVIDALK